MNVLLFGDNFRERDQSGEAGVDATIILKLTFRTWDVVWTGSSLPRISTVGGHLCLK